MKVKPGFIVREICGEKVIAAEGREQIDFGKLICLNDTALFLWQSVQSIEFSPELLSDMLCGRYDVSKEKALADSRLFCEKLQSVGVLE